MKPPVIGICCRMGLVSDERRRVMHGVRSHDIDSIVHGGGLPVLLPLVNREDLIDQYIDGVDGLYLAGGEDIDPEFYGAKRHPAVKEVSIERDRFELSMIRKAFDRQMPILGACRGIQSINVALGGTLIQDLPSERPSAIDHSKGQRIDPWHVLVHPIAVNDGSKLASILGCSTIEVNSVHHQAIDQLAGSLVATARSSDGVIEAVEAPVSFCIGVQAHPELLWQEIDPRWLLLYQAFTKEAAQFAVRRKGR